MKAYTDIEQSKKLAEILPLESADMTYLSEESLVPKVNYNGMVFFNSEEEKPSAIIPCWSLAALLDVLKSGDYRFSLEYFKDEGWGARATFNSVTSPDLLSVSNEPIDACYEMIIKLNEQKLL